MITLTKTMKVIDLLNKIANGEKLPKTMCIEGDIFLKTEGTANTFDVLKTLVDYDIKLNEEVEIIEDTPKENKKIEKLNIDNFLDNDDLVQVDADLELIIKKINEIIDKINKGSEQQ